MFLHVLEILITSALICSAAPTLEEEHCGKPGQIEGATLKGVWNAESYSPGSVATFTCTHGYAREGSIKMACIEGSWIDVSRGQCKVLGHCSKPQQSHENGELQGQWNDETFPPGKVATYICRQGYSQTSPIKIACVEGEWIPISKGQCIADLSCSLPTIAHGKVTNPKIRYKDGDTTEYSCDPGYKPSTPTGLTCTNNSWMPMPLCEGKKCDKPAVLNGIIEYWARFPKHPGGYFYVYCNQGFLSKNKDYFDTITCTKNGWDREAKCFRQCSSPSPDLINAQITHTSNAYIEGDQITFQCHRGFSTSDGKKNGFLTCHPNGRFSGEKCYRTCRTPELPNGVYMTTKNDIEIGNYVTYKCNEGFISSNKEYEGRSQCSSEGWYPKPECKGIVCQISSDKGGIVFNYGTTVRLRCAANTKLEGPNFSQCFYYGWGPELPLCKDSRGQEYAPLVLEITSEPKELRCPPASAPPNAQVINPKEEYLSGDVMEIACEPGYLLDGSKTVMCENGKWKSPPMCIRKLPCSAPPTISNGEISKESLADQYYTGSTVEYKCKDGYHIVGSNEIKCVDRRWLQPPTCVENPCGKPPQIENGRPKDGNKEYKHAESAPYECSRDYTLSENTAAVCLYGKWNRIPKCIYSSCTEPPKIKNGETKAQRKNVYLSGETVTYECLPGFTMGQDAKYITCENSAWTEPPECRRMGQSCTAPPIVQNGDTTELTRLNYPSGTSVKYKCANYYKLEGQETITCRDGKWEKEPICRVPCTVRDIDMQQNNIQFKYRGDGKLYAEHGDSLSFVCIRGYTISDEKSLRVQCLDGVVTYPKCRKEGFCVLQQKDLFQNNIQYSKANEIDNGETIEFECVEGMIPENGLKATCINRQIKYPICSTAPSCLPPKISNALVSPEKNSYASGSSIDIKCEDTYVLNGPVNVKCRNSQWDELPQCYKPCIISAEILDKNHIEIKSDNSLKPLEHGTDVHVKCKTNFRRPGSLIASCYDGIMTYPRCFSGGICRINQQNVDDNNLELDERHENEIFYGEEETIHFKCKAGYSSRTELTGSCTKPEKATQYELTYPVCEPSSG